MLKKHCWTADRLSKEDYPILGLVFLWSSRGDNHPPSGRLQFLQTVWFRILQTLHVPNIAPGLADFSFPKWWSKVTRVAPKEKCRGLNSLIILAAWEIWKHRNSCVFENGRPCIPDLLRRIAQECNLWCMTGASKLQELLAGSLSNNGWSLLDLFWSCFFDLLARP